LKALVICGSSIADVVFATPLIRALKVQLDDLELHVFADLSAAFTLDENPYVDNIHFSVESIWQNYRRLKKQKFHFVVNLSEEWSAACITVLLRTKSYTLKSLRWKRWLMVSLKIDQLPNKHLVLRMFGCVQALGLKPDELGLDYFIPEKDKVSREWLPPEFQGEYMVFCINANYNTRKLPIDRMIELCDKVNKPIVLLGEKDDFETGEVVGSFFGKSVSVTYDKGLFDLNKRTVVYNACGKFSFNQMASIIKQSRAVFTFDNDFIPVASALKRDIYGLWGNTILMFGKYPYRTKFIVLENNRLECRPCSSKGFDKCPRGHFRCMNKIVFDFYIN